MNRGRGIILIIIIALVIIAGMIYYLFSYSQSGTARLGEAESELVTQEVKKDTPADIMVGELAELEEKAKPQKETQEVLAADLARIASLFTERFGSFSNQSSFSNIKDLRMFMTKKMSRWADNYIAKNTHTNVSSEVYFGVVTKAVSTKVISFSGSENKAVIQVATRRREAIGTTTNTAKAYNQNISINFVREGGIWKVDGAYWEER